MKKVLIGIGALVLVVALAAGGVYLHFAHAVKAFATTPYGDATVKTVMLPQGTDATGVGKLLARAHVVSDAEAWHLYLRWDELRPKLKAGEYEFEGPLTPPQVIAKIVKGEVKLHRFTVPEGLRCEEIMPILAATDLNLDAATLAALCTDKTFVHGLHLQGDRLEGYLFPDTYAFPKGVDEAQVVSKMVAHARQTYARLNPHRSSEVKLDEHQIFTLASIIEKETGQPQERPRISCLFHNRLVRHIKLMTDPTVLYGMYSLTGKFDKTLAFHGFPAARETQNGYNTYLIDGLPVGPISNPGAAALEAALHPAKCHDLFFVAKGDGTHTFCPDAKCHEAAVAHYAALRGKH